MLSLFLLIVDSEDVVAAEGAILVVPHADAETGVHAAQLKSPVGRSSPPGRR